MAGGVYRQGNSMSYERLTQAKVGEICRTNFLQERAAEAERFLAQADDAEEREDYAAMARYMEAARITSGG